MKKKALVLAIALLIFMTSTACGKTTTTTTTSSNANLNQTNSTISSVVAPIESGKTFDEIFVYKVSDGKATIIRLRDKDFSGSITLPDTITDGINKYSVTTIGASAFSSSRITGDLKIPDSVTTIGVSAFANCYSLTGPLTIPNSVISIGDYAFSYCSGLKGPLTIPDSVTTIGAQAFKYCTGFMGPLTIPESVTSIGDWAFLCCSRLTDINVSNENTAYSSKDGILYDKFQKVLIACPAERKGQLTIPDSVTTISGDAFYRCRGLSGLLTIPDSVTNIGKRAFSSCYGLTDIDVSNENPAFSSKDGILYDKSQNVLLAYPAGKKGQFSIPDGVVTIDEKAFFNCQGLIGTITIPDSVTHICRNAFEACGNLSNTLTIPDSVTIICSGAFSRCVGLSGLILGNNVSRIDPEAFEWCYNIEQIIAKPIKAPTTIANPFKGLLKTPVLKTPNTPPDDTSYNVPPWSNFVRETG